MGDRVVNGCCSLVDAQYVCIAIGAKNSLVVIGYRMGFNAVGTGAKPGE